MEYYVFLTNRCNLSCKYCCAKVFVNNNLYNHGEINVERLVEYIKKDIHSNEDGMNNSIVFFGGEPLVAQRSINHIIEKTNELYLKYRLFTNGTLLNKTPIELLSRMEVIFVSIDGDKKAHSKYRGENTYDLIMNNIKKIKPALDDTIIIGRVTAEEETNIYESVKNLITVVDAVYWQIVNKSEFKNPLTFIDRYIENSQYLFKMWLNEFNLGNILNIIPFQYIVSSLVFPNEKQSFSFNCGSGRSFQAIDTSGNIYECDEYVGNYSKVLGNIKNIGSTPLKYETHYEIFSDCLACGVKNICLGRCKKGLKTFKDDHQRIYCLLTKRLIEMVKENIEDIKLICQKNNYHYGDIYKEPYCTEAIP